MVDISMCQDGGCIKRRSCFRYRAVPDPHRQSFMESPRLLDGHCSEFLTIYPNSQIAPLAESDK